jgi:hypothetical protein
VDKDGLFDGGLCRINSLGGTGGHQWALCAR